MPLKRIAIAGFQHETNTFCPIPTNFTDFENAGAWPALTKGKNIFAVFSPLNIPIGGFINAEFDWQLIPIVWASAEPAGLVEKQAFDEIVQMICLGITKAGAIDGVYLDLHGALVTDEFEDGEAEIVRRVRQIIGDDLPLVCSLDFHANISPEFVKVVSALTIFRHYPHTDMAQTGARAAKLMNILVHTDIPIHKAFKQIDYLIPLSSQGTTRYPFNTLYTGFSELEESGVLSVDAAAGFPAADIFHSGPCVVAFGTDKSAVDNATQILQRRFVDAEEKIIDELLSPDNAINIACDLIKNKSEPVVLADVQDNPGAGGTCDTTVILQALISQDGVRAIVGIVYDPVSIKTCWQAGIGAELELELGNAFAIAGTKSFSHHYVIEHLADEPVRCTGQMYGGCDADLGAMAVLRATGIQNDIYVVLASQRFQCLDLALFRQMGLTVELPQIIVVKSTIHFLADFEPIAQKVLFVEAPGVHPCKLSNVDYKNLRPGVRIGPLGHCRVSSGPGH